MTPIESAEAFADRQWAWLDREKMREAVRARDAAIRAEALREAADLLHRNAVEAYGYSNAGRDRALCVGLAKSIRALATKEPDDG